MRKITIFSVLLCFVINLGQSSSNSKKRKVYRTQWGTMITAPETAEESSVKKPKSEMKKIQKQIQANINKTTNQHREEMQNLEDQYNSQLSKLQEQIDQLYKLTQITPEPDTVYVFNYDSTVVYDTTTVLDTTFIYTNATTTVYDTAVFYDSLYIYSFDTTTLVQTNYDTMVVYDTSFVMNYDTMTVKDTLWLFAYDTTVFYDTSWVFAYDTTIVKDSLWVFAYDTSIVYDTVTVVNNDTLTIHTYATNFDPEMIDGQEPQFPIWKSLDDAIRARNAGDKRAQDWINQALYAAGGDWTLAKDEYKKFQDIYSSATVKSILRQPERPGFIGPREEMKYRSVTYDTLRILSYDTLVVQDTIRDLYRQTTVNYDTTVITDPNDVIKGITPAGHEMIVRYYDNGKVREKGPMKGIKRNGVWIFFSVIGEPVRRTTYQMGRIIDDKDLVNTGEKIEQTRKPHKLSKTFFKKFDTKPIPKSLIAPVVDFAHDGGSVSLQFQVDRKGVIKKINLLKSSSIIGLDNAAIEALKNMVFYPAKLDNLPINVWTEAEILFPENLRSGNLSAGITRYEMEKIYRDQINQSVKKLDFKLTKNQKNEIFSLFKLNIEATNSEIDALHLEEEGQFLKSEIKNFIYHMNNGDGTLQSGVQLYRATSDSRITLIDQEGQVLAESDVTQEKISSLDNHGDRPEVIASKITEYGIALRHSETLNKKMIYVSYAYDEPKDERRIYVRFAKPIESLGDQRFMRTYEDEVLDALSDNNILTQDSEKEKFSKIYVSDLKKKLAELGYGVDIESNENIIRSYTEKLEEKQNTVASNLKREIETFIKYLSANSYSNLQNVSFSYGQSSDIRVTLLDSLGAVLADSDLDKLRINKLENHMSRPEVAQSKQLPYGVTDRYSNTLDQRFVYVTRRLPKASNGVKYIRLARSLRSDYSRVKVPQDQLLDVYYKTIKKSLARSGIILSNKQLESFSSKFFAISKANNNLVRMNPQLKNYRLYIQEINKSLDEANISMNEKESNKFFDLYLSNIKREFSVSQNIYLEANEESISTFFKNLAIKEKNLEGKKLREGPFISYHDNGRIHKSGSYNNGLKVGDWKEYDKYGKLLKILTYNKGKIDKKSRPDRIKEFATFHDNGRLKEKGKTKNGKRDGEWNIYDKNGDITSIIVYDYGKEISRNIPQKVKELIEYHSNGRIKTKGNTLDGKKDGVFTYYNPRGKIVKSVLFSNGVLIKDDDSSAANQIKKLKEGDHITYHKSGRIKETGKYLNGKKQGEWRKYDKKGVTTMVTVFENGDLIFEQNPNIIEQFVSYHSNGRIKEQGMKRGGERDGEWVLFSKRGKLLRKTNFFRDEVVGQNSTKVINSFVTYHNNGYVKEEGILNMGQRDGIWKVYNNEGSHVETVTYENGKILKRQKA